MTTEAPGPAPRETPAHEHASAPSSPSAPSAGHRRRALSRSRRAVALGVAGLVLAAGAGVAVAQLTRSAPAEPELAAPIDPLSGTVSAYPTPGTAVVHPQAELSFRGLPASDLGDLEVVGSRSGERPGSLLEHSDGQGVSFLPDEPFAEGEEVVVTGVPEVRGAEDGSYTLRVAHLGDRPELSAPEVEELRGGPPDPDGELEAQHIRQFPSAPGIEPPVVEVSGPEAGTVGPQDQTSPGLTAIGVKNGFGQKGPMLVDDAGEPVWFLPLEGVDARDVQVQTYQGEPVVTWAEGRMGAGYGYGDAVILDSSYEEVARVSMAGGYDADSHEVRLTDEGTLLLLAYEPVLMDLRSVGGPAEGVVLDNVVQEIDVATGALLYEWHSVGQVAVAESYLELPEGEDEDEPYDYFHINSIDVDDDGDLLISARHTCAVYSLDRQTGSLQWRLGGRESDLAMGPGTTFLKQHDARRSEDGTLTLFDNGGTCGDTTRELSRGIALDLDEEAMTAELVREHVHPEELFSESQANYQELSDGEVLLGWGSLPRFTLMAADGEVLLDATIPEDLSVTTYRAHRVEWTGRPTTDPSAVLVEEGSWAAVHVSWNGATEVASWRVVDDEGDEVAVARRGGFETVVPLGDAAPVDLRVEALDVDRGVLGAAAVVTAD